MSSLKPPLLPRAPTYKPLVIVLAAVCGGIVADRDAAPALGWWLAAAAAWLLWWLLWRAHRDVVSALALIIALAAVGGAWHHDRWALFEANHAGLLSPEIATPAALEVQVVGAPPRMAAPPHDAMRTLAVPERTRLEVDVLAIRDRDAWRPLQGAATLTVDGQFLDVAPGDRLRVFGELAATSAPHNPGEFDFARHARLARRLCHVRAEFP